MCLNVKNYASRVPEAYAQMPTLRQHACAINDVPAGRLARRLERCKSAYATHREDACPLYALPGLQNFNLLTLDLGCFPAGLRCGLQCDCNGIERAWPTAFGMENP